jgi:hypothetical protein
MTFSLAEAASDTPAGLSRADFYTGQLLIRADIDTGPRRLLDVLRDATRKYLDVRTARVVSFGGPSVEREYQAGLVSKEDIEWIAVRAEPPRTEARLYAFVRKTPVRVAFVLRDCVIEGTVHVDSGSTDAVAFFLRGLEKPSERFIAVTGATVTAADGSEAEPAPLVIVNRTAVRLYSAKRVAA